MPPGYSARLCLIMGQHDLMTPPRNSQPMVERLAKTQTLLLRNCGHSMLSEQPNEVLDGLRTVLLSLP